MDDCGFLYLIGNKDLELYKIGISEDPISRVRHFQTGSPFPIFFLHAISCIEGTRPQEAEKILHLKFQERKTRGEWFSLKPKDTEYIFSIAAYDIHMGGFVYTWNTWPEWDPSITFNEYIGFHAGYTIGFEMAISYNRKLKKGFVPVPPSNPFPRKVGCHHTWNDGWHDGRISYDIIK